MPTSTVEDYLKAILLEEHGRAGRVGTGQIAGRLGLSPGTVTAMLKALAEGGLVSYEPYNGVRLAESGQRAATHVLRRHRLLGCDEHGGSARRAIRFVGCSRPSRNDR